LRKGVEASMDDREAKSIIEGLLFTFGDPLESKELGRVLELSHKEVTRLLKEMKDEFDFNEKRHQAYKIQRFLSAWNKDLNIING